MVAAKMRSAIYFAFDFNRHKYNVRSTLTSVTEARLTKLSTLEYRVSFSGPEVALQKFTTYSNYSFMRYFVETAVLFMSIRK